MNHEARMRLQNACVKDLVRCGLDSGLALDVVEQLPQRLRTRLEVALREGARARQRAFSARRWGKCP